MLTHDELVRAAGHCLEGVDLPQFGERIRGKVRDIYRYGGQRILITSDRVSAFDRVLGLIPYKGQVLNQLSAWWFEQTKGVVRNHVVAVPDPNVTIAREAEPLPVEIVVRGYITGVTNTSLWTLYEQGERRPYGVVLPEGLRKNDRLPEPIITPTTKAEKGGHDERITAAEIVERGLVEEGLWAEVERTAIGLFQEGQRLAERAGLILVDTKYEMGLVDGQLTLIDEVHTPDSSRYWTMASYEAGAPENISKEFLREWYAEQGYKGEGVPPEMPADFRAQVAARYIEVYERVTGQAFEAGVGYSGSPIGERIERNLGVYFGL